MCFSLKDSSGSETGEHLRPLWPGVGREGGVTLQLHFTEWSLSTSTKLYNHQMQWAVSHYFNVTVLDIFPNTCSFNIGLEISVTRS